MSKAKQLWDDRKSPWQVVGTEYPIQVKGRDSRIDLVLQLSRDPDRVFRALPGSFFMTIECKRADPSLWQWCFARSSQLRAERQSVYLVEDLDLASQRSSAARTVTRPEDRPFDIAWEKKRSDGRGESGPSGRGAIERAATQALIGASGFIEELHRLNCTSSEMGRQFGGRAFVLPVVMTTAELLATDEDITAQLDTGVIAGACEPRAKPWVHYYASRSLSLQHGFGPHAVPESWARVLQAEFLRSIPIVHGSAIDSFLSDPPFEPEDLRRR